MTKTETEPLLIREQEVAEILGVSVKTLQSRMRCGFPQGELDLAKIAHKACGKRFWVRRELYKALGV